MARGQSDADYERVNALVASGMKKMQAFAAVGAERGVSANGVGSTTTTPPAEPARCRPRRVGLRHELPPDVRA